MGIFISHQTVAAAKGSIRYGVSKCGSEELFPVI